MRMAHTPKVISLLHAQNPISLRTAIVQDDGRSIYLVLLLPQSSMAAHSTSGKCRSIMLYRHKTTFFKELLYVLGRGPTHDGLPEPSADTNASKGKVRKWVRQIFYRKFIVGQRREIKAMSFENPPDLKLLWDETGRSVAVFLNREPWAFIHENRNHGYSKGNLKPGYGNTWDQELFEKTFA